MSDELAHRNRKSWQTVLEYYEEEAEYSDGDHLSPILGVVRALQSSDAVMRFRAGLSFSEVTRRFRLGRSFSDVARQFRAGQSFKALIISTAPKNRLEADEPFVVVTLSEKTQMFLIEYRIRVVDGWTVERIMCSERECMSYLLPVLNRLWEDTRGRRAT